MNKINAGIRRPRRRQPGETAATARAFRFLEVALSPRMLLIGGGLAFMVRARRFVWVLWEFQFTSQP